jgi:hypothetical protein
VAKKIWVYSPKRQAKAKVSDSIKFQLKSEADILVENVLKPRFIAPPPKENDFNYLVDIFTKWYRNYFYFCSKYNCPGPNAISPSFESKFARLEYVGPNALNRDSDYFFKSFNGR